MSREINLSRAPIATCLLLTKLYKISDKKIYKIGFCACNRSLPFRFSYLSTLIRTIKKSFVMRLGKGLGDG